MSKLNPATIIPVPPTFNLPAADLGVLLAALELEPPELAGAV